MTLSISTGSKDVIVEALQAKWTGGIIRVFTGERPASSDMAENSNGATQIGVVTNGGIPVGFADSGLNLVVSTPYIINDPLQNWVLVPSAISADAWWFRYVADPNDDGGASYGALRFDGDAGVGETFELNLPSTTLTFGNPVSPLSFFYAVPPTVD